MRVACGAAVRDGPDDDRTSRQRRTRAAPQVGAPWPRSLPPVLTQTGGPAVANDHTPQPANAAEALDRLGRLSLRESSMQTLLQTVAALATSVLPANPEASVTLLV